MAIKKWEKLEVMWLSNKIKDTCLSHKNNDGIEITSFGETQNIYMLVNS